jgi:hypothetical protein
MRNKLTKITLAAGFVLVMAFASSASAQGIYFDIGLGLGFGSGSTEIDGINIYDMLKRN